MTNGQVEEGWDTTTNGGTTLRHDMHTEPSRTTRANAPPRPAPSRGSLQGWRACPRAQPGRPTRGAPSAAPAWQLHSLLRGKGAIDKRRRLVAGSHRGGARRRLNTDLQCALLAPLLQRDAERT